MPEFIKVQERNQIFEILIDREDKRNAMHQPMMDEIDQALDQAERSYLEGRARVIFIRTEGRVFSSGIDLSFFLENDNDFGENWRDNLFPTTYKLQAVMNKIENHSLPVFCLMNGYCLGMALELALACDFRLVAERTKLALPETRLGIIPDVGGTTRLTKIVGPARAKQIILTGSNIETADAERWGLVHYVTPKDELLTKAEELAQEIIASAPLAVSYGKRVINDITDTLNDLRKEAMAQAYLIRTDDFENGVKAMLTKSYPIEWKGK